jgi:hypothetical protein
MRLSLARYPLGRLARCDEPLRLLEERESDMRREPPPAAHGGDAADPLTLDVFTNRQRAAGTRRVRQLEHARSRADTADTR